MNKNNSFEQNTHNNQNSKYTAQPALNSEHFCIKGPLHQIHHLGFYSWKHLYIYIFYNFSMLFFLDSNWLELYKKFHGCRGLSHTHLLCHNALFIYKTYVSHQFTELILQDMVILWLPFGRWLGGGGKGRGKLEQGSHFFYFLGQRSWLFLKFELNILS